MFTKTISFELHTKSVSVCFTSVVLAGQIYGIISKNKSILQAEIEDF